MGGVCNKLYASTYDNAWPLSRIMYSWMDTIVAKARFKKLKEEELKLPKSLGTDTVVSTFEKTWNQELQKKSPSLLWVLIKCFWVDFVLAGIAKLFWGGFVCLCAFYFVNELIKFVQDKSKPDWLGWVFAGSFYASCMLLSIMWQQMSHRAIMVGIRIRTALLDTIYKKMIRLDIQQINSGDVISICSNDCTRLMESCTSFHYLWSGVVETIVILSLLGALVQLSVLPGVGVMVIAIVLLYILGHIAVVLRTKNINVTDERVSVMTEILLSIKLVKLYAWEMFFAKHVKKIRRKEVKFMVFSGLIKSVNLMIVFAIPPLIAIVLFTTHVLTKENLSASIAFTVLSLFNTLRFPLVVLPQALRAFSESVAALRRISAFLLQKDFEAPKKSEEAFIKMEKANFAYSNSGTLLHDLDIHVPKGKLLSIVGTVGSGKSNVMLSILGQMNLTSGKFDVGGKMAYVPQQPWCQHGTIKDNILFGKPYDEDRYFEAVKACALTRDFEILPLGDQTELGERGINLSGGQKQRIALARAVYANADMYLLDSPLSAVDQHTCIHIFNECIKGVLKDKTIILITHHLELLQDCDLIAVMLQGRLKYFGSYGPDCEKVILEQFPNWKPHEPTDQTEVKDAVTYEPEPKKDNLVTDTNEFLVSANIAQPIPEISVSISPENEQPHKQNIPAPQNTMVAQLGITSIPRAPSSLEESTSASNDAKDLLPTHSDQPAISKTTHPKSAEIVPAPEKKPEAAKETPAAPAPKKKFLIGYRAWFSACGYFLVIISVAIFAVTQSVRIVSDRWVGWWASDLFVQNQTWYIWTYSCFVAGFMTLLLIRGLAYYGVVLRGATKLHSRMFKKVLRAPLVFFINTPLGSLLNCLSKDQDCADQSLTDTTHMTLIYLMILLTTLIIVCITLPYYTIVAGVLFVAFFTIFFIYEAPATFFKKLSSKTNAKIFEQLSESLSGLSVIRAFNCEERFINEYAEKINKNNNSVFHTQEVQLWLSFRLDFISSTLVFITATFAVLFRNTVDAASMGLAISNSFQQLIFFTWVVRGLSDINAQIGCMERLNKYATMSQTEAAAHIPETVPAEDWPQGKSIEIKNLFLRYIPNQDPVLKDVTVKINEREKIGIVGRTGSGKSTLLISLFRLIEPDSGTILIDGIDVSKLGLSDLRKRIAIIPQEPVLFKGTVRSNLDPFDLYPDKDLWHALECAHLKADLEKMPEQLMTAVAENGSNFSLGQKQLFCLARAALNKSKVIVLDEATAAMDSETDFLIQQTIRQIFADRIVITIAHRLDTIIDSDRILVMDQGVVKDFDSPWTLLQKEQGIFAQLVEQTGEVSSMRLRQRAREVFDQKSNPSRTPVLKSIPSVSRMQINVPVPTIVVNQ